MIGRRGLGPLVGAFFFAVPIVGSAQVVVPPASEVPIPPRPETDSTKAQTDTIKAKTDTIKHPFGRLESPRTADIGPQYEWNREELFASGAYTVADLLERIPGTTSFRSGWLASPKFVAVNGDLSRVRVFYDGIEMDNLDGRSGTMLDLTTIDLWTLENVAVERFASEVRVHLKSWRVERTSPYTRTDVYTGDEDTNIYRGFYGKRFDNGAGLQLGGQQFSTRSARLRGGGDALTFMARAGIARRMWSVDAYAVRRNAARVVQPTFGNGLSLPEFTGTHTLAYLRAAVGNHASGPWVQVIAANMNLHETTDHVDAATALSQRVRPDTADSTIKRIQYLATAGFARGVFRGSISDRIRAFRGETYHSPEARLELGSRIAAVDLFGQQGGEEKRRKLHAAFRLNPVSFLAIAGALSSDRAEDDVPGVPPGDAGDSTALPSIPNTTAARLELGVRVWNPWLIAGFITRDTAVLAPPAVVDTVYHYRAIGKRQGLYAGIRGRVYKDINIDVVGTRWDSAGYYQPRFQSRSELNLDTRWMKRFPSGSFGLKLAAIHEHRGVVRFPLAEGFATTRASNVFSALVEIRILRGVATYQVRNIFGQQYQIFPDFFMPRSLGIYGLRWEFWN